MNLRTRVALAGGAVVVAALALVGAVEYAAIDSQVRGQMDTALRQTAETSTDLYTQVRMKLAAAEQDPDARGTPFTVGNFSIQFIEAPRAGTPAKFADVTARDVAVAAGTAAPYYDYVDYQKESYRVYTAPLPGDPGVLVRAAQLASDPTPTLHRLLWLLWLLTPAAGLLALLGGRLLAGRVLRPVGELTATVEHITATGDLTTPVDARGRDEVGRLGRAFTAMTAALDGSVGAQRRLVADASHELRTPLTSLTTNLELLAENPADPQTPALVADALDQARELGVLINDLVDLARFGEAAPHTEDVRLDVVAARLAAQRGVAVAADTPVVVHGDPDALERAIANLVDNAVKFGGSADSVLVSVRVGGAGEVRAGIRGETGGGIGGEVRGEAVAAEPAVAVVEVRDHGPGIPAADLPYVFDRFHRSPAARSLPGSGLGLAIVRQIAEAHGGRAEAVSPGDGALVRITLPATIDSCSGPSISPRSP